MRKLSLAVPFRTDYAVFVTLRHAVPLPAVDLIRDTLRRIAAGG